ncbi:MAG TPA: hypothetical protein VGE07_22880 [Herpetosiphonaceae bacterium]
MLPKYLERLIFLGCALLLVACLTFALTRPYSHRLAQPIFTLLPPAYPQTTAVLTHTATLTADHLVFQTPDDGLAVARWYTDTLAIRGWDPAPWITQQPPGSEDRSAQRHGFIRYLGCSRYTLLLSYDPATGQVSQTLEGGAKVGKSC